MLAIIPYKQAKLRDFANGDFDDQDCWEDELEDHDDYLTCDEEIEVYGPLQTADHDEIFASQEQMEESLLRLCNGDLYLLGTIYIKALRSVLVGAPLGLIPVVKAAEKPPPVPPKPPKMKYKDLPIYESPHYEYKQYVTDKEKCPEANKKLISEYLLPHVKNCRKEAQAKFCKFKCVTKKTLKEAYCSYECTKNDIKAYMRDPNNLAMRQGLVAGSILTGLLMGSTLTRKIFYSGVGGLTTGALCFPNETDEFFRNLAFHTGKTFISLYNMYCNKNFMLRERVPCSDSVPSEPPQRKDQCPQPPGKKKWF